MSIYIGTSGWSYYHWKESFYPPRLPTAEWLSFYAKNFGTVEINTTFYHAPLETTIKKWFEAVPKDFQFCIKASRDITHLKRLEDCEENLSAFYSSIKKLKKKTGPILFQFPPSFSLNEELLKKFLLLLKKEYRYTFEFRHKTWFCDSIYKLLAKHGIALCISDLNGKLSPIEVTADFTYLRLHGPQKAYKGLYGPERLRAWKKQFNEWTDAGKEVFCFFDNDEKGYSIEDAKFLINLK